MSGRDDLSCPEEPYRLVSRKVNPQFEANLWTRTVTIAGVSIGSGQKPVIIAGPCAVESEEQTLDIARAVKEGGADMLRGGVYKPRTSPYDFQGLGEEGLEILALAREETGLPVVSEVLDVRLVDQVGQYADVIQVGSRSMRNFPLLVEVGKYGKPVLLKRGMAATLEEWLCAAEYIAKEGNMDIILCERGIRTFTIGEYSRFSLDLSVIKGAIDKTFLPIIVDPSHATGDPAMVPAASRAAIQFGAHGLLIEVIGQGTDRRTIKCDGHQGIRPSVFRELTADINGWWAMKRSEQASPDSSLRQN